MPPPLTIQYLGQEGFRFGDGTRSLVIDPYLSDSVDRLDGFAPGYWTRRYPPPLRPDELSDVDLVLCSHDHLDHADPETLTGLARASPRCRFAGPRQTVALMHRIGLEPNRTTVVQADRPVEVLGIGIEPVAAAHERYEVDADGHHRFLGFLLRWRAVTLFHAGDSVATPELSARLARERIDIGFLPVNGGDDARRRLGVVGNMDVAAAAALAERHQFRLLVPMHYDLYVNNGLSAPTFAALWAQQPAAARVALKTFEPGERLEWPLA